MQIINYFLLFFFTFFWGVFVRSSGEEAGEALGDGKLHIISFQVFNFFSGM